MGLRPTVTLEKDTVITSRQTGVSGFTAYSCVVASLNKVQAWQPHARRSNLLTMENAQND
ncbi:MAG: hypothetical protein IKI11_02030 [Neisseriaceae bacterium]|nr:hypothetical protein [Neisseriaceae bacterium]